MKVKTSELTGAPLDWAVAKVEGDELAARIIQYPKQAKFYSVKVTPSTDWSQGGPIIEREHISLVNKHDGWWVASRMYNYSDEQEYIYLDDNPLVAAMRCYVASKLGDTVDIPEEILS